MRHNTQALFVEMRSCLDCVQIHRHEGRAMRAEATMLHPGHETSHVIGIQHAVAVDKE